MERIHSDIIQFTKKRDIEDKIKIIIQVSNSRDIFENIAIFTRNEYGNSSYGYENTKNLIKYFDYFETSFSYNPSWAAFYIETKCLLLEYLVKKPEVLLMIPKKSKAKFLFRDLEIVYQQLEKEEQNKKEEYTREMVDTLVETYKNIPTMKTDIYSVTNSSRGTIDMRTLFRQQSTAYNIQ